MKLHFSYLQKIFAAIPPLHVGRGLGGGVRAVTLTGKPYPKQEI